MSRMKVSTSATEALITHLKWLKSRGELNCEELARRMTEAGVPKDDCISGPLFRMLALGRVDRLVEDRVLAACRVLGIQATFVDLKVPDNYKPQ